MGAFEHCHYCVAPKRHPGCQDTCPYYVIDKAFHDAQVEAQREQEKIDYNIKDQLHKGMLRAIKGGNKKKEK